MIGMKRYATAIGLGLTLTLNGCAQIELPQPLADSCELVPVFMEEFDTLSVSPNRIGPARWTAHTPWNGDFGDALFTDPGPEGPFDVSDGMLTITAWKDDDDRWRSGLLAAADRSGRGHGTQYGYFEARMKFPPGPGTWPAFWLVPLRPFQTIEGHTEIGVIEYYGHDTEGYQVGTGVHSEDPEKKTGTVFRVEIPDELPVDEFNTYGLDISPEWTVYFFNGDEVWRAPTPDALQYPMYPIVNLALGSGWPIDQTPDPSVMLVDYVRVYGRSDRTDCAPGLVSNTAE